MRMLNDFKIPNFKIPKIKIPNFLNVEELKKDIESKETFTKNKTESKYYDIIRYKTIRDMFLDVTEKYKDNVVILQKFDHKEKFTNILYKDFKEDVIGFSTGLIELLGMSSKRVVIIGENTYEWYVTYMSLLCSGIIAVPVDKELPYNEIENVIKRSKASCIIYSSKKKDEIEKIKDNVSGIEYFVEMYSEKEFEDKSVGFNYIMNIGKQLVKSGNNKFDKTTVSPDEFKILIFTSGTTSNSKGVMLCNTNLVDNIYGALSYAYMDENDRYFSVLPLHHTYESTIGFLMPISKGGSIVVCEGLKYIVPNLKETNPTIMLAVPVLIENLYKKINLNIKKSKKENIVNSMIHVSNALKSVNIDIKRKVFKEIHDTLGGKLRIIVSAAAPIDGKIGKWIEDIGILFLQGYGLTETAPIAAFTPDYKPKIGSAGLPVRCAQIKILDPNEKGEGEVLIKSTTLMLGYYEDEELTNKTIKDGWFYSGDIGYIDEEGYLFITGRSKNVIVTSNGKNIYPEELELLVGEIPYVKDCMVYGAEDKKDIKISVKITLNEEYIKNNFDIRPSDDELYKIIWNQIKTVNKKLTSYKAIKSLEIKKDDFIKTTTMKIKRHEELKKN